MKLFKEVINKNMKMIIFYVILGIVSTFLSLYCINYFQKVLDAFQVGELTIKMIFFYGIILLISTALGYIDNYPEQKLKNGLYLDFKLQTLKKMTTINYLEYQHLGTGRLIQKVEDGSNAAREVVFQFWLKLIRYLIPTALFSLIFIFSIEKRLILFIIGGYIAVIIISNIILKKLYKLKEKILVNQETLNKHLVRGFMELVVFRINKKYDTEIKIAEDGIKNIVNGKTKIKLVHEMFFTSFAILVCIIKIIILIYALINRNLTIGAVVTLISLIEKSYEPIAIFNVEYVDYKLNIIALKRYIGLLELSDDEALSKGIEAKNLEGNIKFENVRFAYSNKLVIENLSFEISKETTIAFVGESGSGKSTIIKQITGLNKPQSGVIMIDNYNLKDLNLNNYYDYISYVSQETPIFDGTLRENIVFNKKVSDNKIEEVLKLVCLDKFYLELENGLETEVGEKGILMSGGERQRVALARLFFDDSKIIILDEATSAMDNITEKIAMENIMKKLTNKTIIIIAHRLETIKNVDNIYVLKSGKVVEEGKYDELMKKGMHFTKLYNASKKQ